ncbi:D-alanyl-D-alanine carboxypeptidase [Microbacterium awajiense]
MTRRARRAASTDDFGTATAEGAPPVEAPDAAAEVGLDEIESATGVRTVEEADAGTGTADDDGADAGTDPADPDDGSPADDEGVRVAEPAPVTAALAWLDESTLTSPIRTAPSAADTGYEPASADLLADPPRRSPWRASVLVPIASVLLVVAAYAVTTLLWPLHAIAPTVAAVPVQPIAAPAATPAWPAQGSAAISVGGIPGTAATTLDASSIASITKVVTALAVLDEMPLEPGEQGLEFRFGYADTVDYWNYLARGESALDVPSGGVLTEYQLLEGMLVGSANNYADRLAGNLWPTDAVYADAANDWLRRHGVPGVTVVEPTGIDPGNIADPAALIPLAQRALANPVIAEIVAKQVVELPGAGLVENTNGLLADDGVVGIKTGTLNTYELLSAKDIVVGETPVRLYAAVMGQPDDEARLDASRALYDQLEAELQLVPSVTAGTTAGMVDTAWGEQVAIVTAADAAVILWNGGSGTVTTTYALGDNRDAGDEVGTLSVRGPLDDMTVELRLAADIEGPSAWWRLTHPLELFGLAG